MGLSSTVFGEFKITPKPTKEFADLINGFSSVIINDEIVDNPNSISHPEIPTHNQPSEVCDWVIDGDKLISDDSDRFYEFEEWLHYLIKNFFKPNGYVLNGEASWDAEDVGYGMIVVKKNKISIQAERMYDEDGYDDDEKDRWDESR